MASPVGSQGAIFASFEQAFRSNINGTDVIRPSVKDLIGAGVSAEPDYAALNVFTRTGMFLGIDTAFRDIQFASDIPYITASRTTLNRTQVIEAYIDLFRQSVSRCIASTQNARVIMGLSSGRDSRHILLELHRQRRLPESVWTLESSIEPAVPIARMLADRVGVRHIVALRTPGTVLQDELTKNLATGFATTQHGPFVRGVPIVSDYDAIYDGIGGDVLSAGLFLNEADVAMIEHGRIDAFVEGLVSSAARAPLLAGSISRSVVLERVSREFRRHLPAPDPISSFYFFNRTRRDIASAPFALFRPRQQTVLAPYLDDDLVRFLRSLPAEMTVDKKLHDDVIARAYPEFADIPYGRKTKLVPISRIRAEARAIFPYVAFGPSIIDKPRVVMQIGRILTSSTYAKNSRWLIRLAVFLSQLGRLR